MFSYKQITAFCSVASLVTIPLVIAPAQAQQSYPLVCRGGGGLSIVNTGNNNVRINFRAAAGSAPQGLQPGECSWQDRAFRSGEPTVICDTSARAVQYVSKLVQSNEYATLQVFNNNQGCMQANAPILNDPPVLNVPAGIPAAVQFRPDLNQVWQSNYGNINWLEGWYGTRTNTIAITSQGWDSSRNAYVVQGRWGRTNNSSNTGSFEMVFDTACSFTGGFSRDSGRTGGSWNGSCQ
ncbi:hypothetical protein AWQ21_12335 [Picosynechococcus sp. PCC 7003]|nr:hypothetical protein AWQ21_12335 [Picosynechococcus sp. PCC 7003]